MRLLLAQLRSEMRVMLRNGEQLLLTIGIPTMLLVFFGTVEILPAGEDEPIAFLVPGIIALSVQSAAMVSLGIATGFERSYLVLKRLGATPLGRPRLIAAKIGAVFAVEMVQVCVLIPVALGLGWSPASTNVPALVGTVLIGTAAFAGIGLTLAGRLRGETNLAAQNGLYLLFLLLGGMVFPVSSLPGPLRAVAEVLPSAALSDVVRSAVGVATTGSTAPLVVLVTWAVAAPAIAASTFRWS